MTTYTWTVGSGYLDQASNWNPATVPTSSDTAVFNATGGNLADAISVGTLDFLAYSWTLGGQIIAGTLDLDGSGLGVLGSAAQLEITQSLITGLTNGATLYASNAGEIIDTAGPGAAASQFGNASLSISGRAMALFSGNLSLGVNGKSTTATVDEALLTVGGTLLVGAGGSPAAGSALLTVQDGGQLVMNGAANSGITTPILQLGTLASTAGTIEVTGTRSLLLSTNNGSTVGVAGAGTLTVIAGGTAQFGTANNGLDPALTLAAAGGAVGNAYVSGSGTALTAAGSILVGGSGSATLTVNGGASVTASASLQSAFSVAATAGHGAVTVDGSGTVLIANGTAVIGGDNRGAGVRSGGTGTVTVSDGADFQVGSNLTVFSGSQITVDGTSAMSVGGGLTLGGTVASYGTVSVQGTLSGAGALEIGAGTASLAAINGATIDFSGSAATIDIGGVSGSNTIAGMNYGDEVDLAGITGANIGTNEVFLQNGATISLPGAPSGTQFVLTSDGNGGTDLSLTPETIGVYRFFDTIYGTQFLTSSATEEAQIIATRPDLSFEGVGLQAVDPNSGDPNAAPVYRFFDSIYGTHFFTASTAERDQVIATRSDLIYEGPGFYEHTAEQPGDVPVYRFFDSNYGTHFYTNSGAEKAQILATRPDLVYEGIGFYAPS